MKKEEALKLSEAALEELADALANGKSDQLEKYLETVARFHHYSFGNAMMIYRQRPSASQVAGFAAWKKLGRIVKKGEKGICILAPMVRKRDQDEEGSTVFGFRAVHVFDVAQTEGDELPDINRISGDPGEQLESLHQVAAARGIVVTFEDDLGGAEGVSKGGKISLLAGLSPAEEFATLAHEICHEALHHGQDRSQFSKVVRELEAEAASFVIAKVAGLRNALGQSADYIQLYTGDQEQLMRSLERIQKTASMILVEIKNFESKCLQKSV